MCGTMAYKLSIHTYICMNCLGKLIMEELDTDFFNHEHMMNSWENNEESFVEVEEILQEFAFSVGSENQSNSSTNSFGFLNNKNKSLLVTNSNSSNSIIVPPSTSYTLSFSDSTVVPPTHNQSISNATARTRTSSNSVDHNLAERKRRHELSQRFIALSASIPGLNKIDKASILKEAITYVKHLQNRVNELEEQCPKKINVESVSLMDKIDRDLYTNKLGTASYKTNFDDCRGLPQLEARVLENEVLIRIRCEKLKGVLLKMLTHIKSLDLSVVYKSVLPMGKFALHVAIIAQMGDNYNLTTKELVKSLRQVLFKSDC